MVRQMLELPEVARAGSELAGALTASSRANIELAMRLLARDRTPPAVIPEPAVELVRLMARMGLGLEVVLRVYRLGHAVVWDRVLERADERIPDPAQRSAALATASRYIFEYVDTVAARLGEVHASEREEVRRGRERRALAVVRDVLDGAEPGADAVRSALSYELAGWHVGMLVVGGEAEDVVAGVARQLGASQRLVVPLTGDLAWAWAGRTRAFPRGRRIAAPESAALAVGEPAEGPDGFRRTHAQAREAYRVGELAGGPVARYADTALLSLMLRDPGAARMFQEEELRGIDGDDARSQVLRETLSAWFAAGHNGASTAASLGVHENTVANRLAAIERRTGRAPATRRVELEVALQLRVLLDGG